MKFSSSVWQATETGRLRDILAMRIADADRQGSRTQPAGIAEQPQWRIQAVQFGDHRIERSRPSLSSRTS